MINFDDVTWENLKEHNPKWSQSPDHMYRILIIVVSESGKANSFLNVINKILMRYTHVKKISSKNTDEWNPNRKHKKQNIDSIWWYDCLYAKQQKTSVNNCNYLVEVEN